jgi:hypothetical protein
MKTALVRRPVRQTDSEVLRIKLCVVDSRPPCRQEVKTSFDQHLSFDGFELLRLSRVSIAGLLPCLMSRHSSLAVIAGFYISVEAAPGFNLPQVPFPRPDNLVVSYPIVRLT